jgi:hypothetical protein
MAVSQSALTNLPIEKLTEAKLSGTGTFDVLMRATKTHLEEEFNKGRIKGPEYSTVYLGSLTTVMEQSIRFLMDKDKNFFEVALIEAQVRLADAQVKLVEAQILKEELEKELIAAQAAKIRRETLLIDKQELLIDNQILAAEQQIVKGVVEITNLGITSSLLNGQVNLTTAQKTSTDAQSALVIQKTITEKAQTIATGVDLDSVIGKQKSLYQAQTNGYLRDSEQRAAKLMADTWMTRRTTDEGTVADATNKLDDATVGAAIPKAIQKMMAGVGVTL